MAATKTCAPAYRSIYCGTLWVLWLMGHRSSRSPLWHHQLWPSPERRAAWHVGVQHVWAWQHGRSDLDPASTAAFLVNRIISLKVGNVDSGSRMWLDDAWRSLTVVKHSSGASAETAGRQTGPRRPAWLTTTTFQLHHTAVIQLLLSHIPSHRTLLLLLLLL